MKIKIKNKISGAVLFSCAAASVKIAVKLAIEAKADLSRANLSGANLSGANLSGANLSGANLSGAALDYACWPLWCGSKKVKIDVKIAMQLAAHFCAVECEDKEYQNARTAILKFAMKSHRAGDLNIGEKK